MNRIVRSTDGVHYDPSGKASGRGAYLCQDPRCWDNAIKGRALDRALKTKLNNEEQMLLRSEAAGYTAADPTRSSNDSET